MHSNLGIRIYLRYIFDVGVSLTDIFCAVALKRIDRIPLERGQSFTLRGESHSGRAPRAHDAMRAPNGQPRGEHQSDFSFGGFGVGVGPGAFFVGVDRPAATALHRMNRLSHSKSIKLCENMVKFHPRSCQTLCV